MDITNVGSFNLQFSFTQEDKGVQAPLVKRTEDEDEVKTDESHDSRDYIEYCGHLIYCPYMDGSDEDEDAEMDPIRGQIVTSSSLPITIPKRVKKDDKDKGDNENNNNNNQPSPTGAQLRLQAMARAAAERERAEKMKKASENVEPVKQDQPPIVMTGFKVTTTSVQQTSPAK